MKHENPIARILLAHISRQESVSCTLLCLRFGDRQQPVFLLNHDERFVLPNNAEIRIIECRLGALMADQYLITRMQRRVEVCFNVTVDPYSPVFEQTFNRAFAAVFEQVEEVRKQGGVLSDRCTLPARQCFVVGRRAVATTVFPL